MKIVDAHVHVWTDNFQRYPLAPGFTQRKMKPKTFTPDEILGLAGESNVDRIVLVQMSYYGFSNSFMLDTMARHPGVFGGIAVIDHASPVVRDEMDRLGALGVRGFRIRPEGGNHENWLAHRGYARMFEHAADTGQAICCLIDPPDLPELDRMCHDYPRTTVIIDHLCRIGADGEIREGEVEALCRMAQHTMVMVKVSAFYALGDKKPPHEELLPTIEEVFEAFGAHRLMWGSDCPFQVQGETYEDGLALMRDLFPYRTEGEREWMLSRTADSIFF